MTNLEKHPLLFILALLFSGTVAAGGLILYANLHQSPLQNSLNDVNFSQYGYENITITSDETSPTVNLMFNRSTQSNARLAEGVDVLSRTLAAKSTDEAQNYGLTVTTSGGTSAEFEFDATSPSDYTDNTFADHLKAFFVAIALDPSATVSYKVSLPDNNNSNATSNRIANISYAPSERTRTPDKTLNAWTKLVTAIPTNQSIRNKVSLTVGDSAVTSEYTLPSEKENLLKHLPVGLFKIFASFTDTGGLYGSGVNALKTVITVAPDGTNNTVATVTVVEGNNKLGKTLRNLAKDDPQSLLPSGMNVQLVTPDNPTPFYIFRPSNGQW